MGGGVWAHVPTPERLRLPGQTTTNWPACISGSSAQGSGDQKWRCRQGHVLSGGSGVLPATSRCHWLQVVRGAASLCSQPVFTGLSALACLPPGCLLPDFGPPGPFRVISCRESQVRLQRLSKEGDSQGSPWAQLLGSRHSPTAAPLSAGSAVQWLSFAAGGLPYPCSQIHAKPTLPTGLSPSSRGTLAMR